MCLEAVVQRELEGENANNANGNGEPEATPILNQNRARDPRAPSPPIRMTEVTNQRNPVGVTGDPGVASDSMKNGCRTPDVQTNEANESGTTDVQGQDNR
jgi:hypothetical protein